MQKKKMMFALGGAALLLVTVVLWLTVAVNVKGAFTEGGGCIAVAFDKASVMNADKIIMRYGDVVHTITDPDCVREIAAGFVVANRSGLCESYTDNWLEIYNGDKLVRKIRWSEHGNLAEIYEVDAAHWVFPGESGTGQIELSEEFMARLQEIIWAHND